jgi:hypothetical protein
MIRCSPSLQPLLTDEEEMALSDEEDVVIMDDDDFSLTKEDEKSVSMETHELDDEIVRLKSVAVLDEELLD